MLAVPVAQLRELVATDRRPRRPDPARLPDPPLDPDQPRRRRADHRLAVLAGRPAAAGLRGAQPDPGPVAGPGGRPGRRGSCSPSSAWRPRTRPLVILFGRQLLRNPGNAELAARDRAARARRVAEATCDLLVVGAGPGGPVRRRLRRLGGPGHRGPRRRRHGRPGRHVIADRELPRLPVRHLRRRARRAGRHPGPQVRRPVRRARRGHRPRPGRRPVHRPAGRRHVGDGPGGRHRHRRPLPPAGRAAPGALREDQRLLRRVAGRGAALPRTTRWRSSAAATRPARRRVFLAAHAPQVTPGRPRAAT